MRYKFLPSFVKRRGRITQSQEDNLKLLPNFLIESYEDICREKTNFSKLILEIGFGNGENIISLAQDNPDTLFIGSEVYLAGIGYLIGEIQDLGLVNIRINTGDIRLLIEQVEEPVFDDVLIICPDPWPKARHHKRRLIKADFLELVHPIIKDKGELFISTDWENYAESIEEAITSSSGYGLLTKSSYQDSSLTKFQKRAVEEGRDIYVFPLKKLIK
jgi:tRNA (guanine-N7-)-methyltransferase|tara:strand:+ start:10132 stop:10782 length:651 start_codon:yes stop_codon:yes gene_type:complete